MSPVGRGLVWMVRAYQKLPRLRPPVCRFDPTCSSFAVEAIEVHGAFRGTWLALRRVGKCHPWGPTGWDPVPPRRGSVEPPEAQQKLGVGAEGKAV